MNKQTYFSFLESLNGPKAVVEAIKIGYSICFEGQFSERMQGFKMTLEADANFKALIDHLRKIMSSDKDVSSLELDALKKLQELFQKLTTDNTELNDLWNYIERYYFKGRFRVPDFKKVFPFYRPN